MTSGTGDLLNKVLVGGKTHPSTIAALEFDPDRQSQKVVGAKTDVAVLVGTQQNFTGSWVDFGSEIESAGYNTATLWLKVVSNDSTSMRVRLLAKHTVLDADEFTIPLFIVGPSSVTTVGEYWELTNNVSQNIAITWQLGNSMPVIQFQIEAGVVGATAGTAAASITLGY